MTLRRAILLITVVLLMAFLLTACSSDSNGPAPAKSGKVDEKAIEKHVLQTCNDLGMACKDAAFAPLRVVALTQVEMDGGVYQRICGIITLDMQESDGEISSNKGLVMFERDRLGWHGFYFKGYGSEVRNDYNKKAASLGQNFWTEKGCGTITDYKLAEDKIE